MFYKVFLFELVQVSSCWAYNLTLKWLFNAAHGYENMNNSLPLWHLSQSLWPPAIPAWAQKHLHGQIFPGFSVRLRSNLKPKCSFTDAMELCFTKRIQGRLKRQITALTWLLFLLLSTFVIISNESMTNWSREWYPGAGGHVTYTRACMLFILSGGWTQVGSEAPEEITQQAHLHAATDARKRPPSSSRPHERGPAY